MSNVFNAERLGRNIKKLRLAEHKTLKDVAAHFKEVHGGMTHQTISNWERGFSSPSIEELYTLAAYLHHDVSYLLENTDNEIDISGMVQEYTGLSQSTIKTLHEWTKKRKDTNSVGHVIYSHCLNTLNDILFAFPGMLVYLLLYLELYLSGDGLILVDTNKTPAGEALKDILHGEKDKYKDTIINNFCIFGDPELSEFIDWATLPQIRLDKGLLKVYFQECILDLLRKFSESLKKNKGKKYRKKPEIKKGKRKILEA